MIRTGKTLALAFKITMLGLTVAASQAVATDKAVLAYTQTLYSAHVVIAREKGLFAKYGVEIEPKLFTAGRLTLDAVLARGADFATTAETPMTAAVMAGQPIAILARLAKATPTTLVHAESNIKTAADLRGKKLGITAGTGSEVYAFTLLGKAGLKPADVTFVNLRPEDMPAALMNRSVDAISTWQPFVSNAQKLLGAKATVLNTPGIYNETWNLVVTQDYLKSNAGTATALIKALLEAEAFIDSNRAEAMDILSRVVGVDRKVVESSWSDFEFRIAVDPAIVDILEAHSRWRLATGNHPSGVSDIPDFRKVIFSRPLKAASAQRVSGGY